MPTIEGRKLSLGVTLVLVALNLVALNILAGSVATPRLDLTENRIYSISDATRRLLDSLEDDVTIYGFFSSRTHPKLAPLIPEIEDLLDEYAAAARGRVRVEMVDPGTDEEAEQRASERFGVTSTPFQLASKYETGIVNAYFALVVQYGDEYERYGFDDLIEVEPLPAGEVDVRLRNLEYDLTRAIKKVVYGFGGRVGVFERLEEPVRLVTIMTPGSLPDLFQEVPEAVRAAAQQLTEESGGKLVYEELDPHADPAAREAALSRYGAQPLVLGLFGGDEFYLYGFLEVGEEVEQLPLTAEGVTAAGIRESVLSALERHTPGFLKTVGIAAPDMRLPPEVVAQYRMQGMQPPESASEYQELARMLERDYLVKDVSLDVPAGVPADVDTLLVVNPKDLSERAVYNLDQYLMRGGRVILCVDNYEVEFSRTGLSVSEVDTGLDEWLGHFGVEIGKELLLDDRNRPFPVPEERVTAFGRVRGWSYQPYPYLLEVRDDGIVDDRVAANIDALGIYWGSPVELVPPDSDADATSNPAHDFDVLELLRSSERSWTDDATDKVSRIDYTVPEETEPHAIALALHGTFGSFFAGRQPPASEAADEEAGEPEVTAIPLERSPETRLVVIGNAEFLSDFVAQVLGSQESGYFLQNLSYVQNLIDWINLDSDLLGIRSETTVTRRLPQLSRGNEVAIEVANYLVPVALLALIGALTVLRRRRTPPWIASTDPEGGER